MESKTKIFGHPAHTILIVFPLGLLATAVIADVGAKLCKKPRWAELAQTLTGAGLIGGAVAAPFGMRDWLAIPEGTRAKSIGLWHGAGNAVVLSIFLGSYLLRRKDPADPPLSASLLSLLGFGLAGVTGWLGGELVNRLGVGVDDGANLDAPSSLTGLSAGDSEES